MLHSFLRKHFWTIAATALLALFLGRVTSLYLLQSDTYDEHAHISETLRWIEENRFAADGFQAPLPRLAIAAGPYFAGFGSNTPWMAADWSNPDLGDYWRSLTLGRLGALPFAILLFATVALWSKRLYGAAGSLASLVVLSFSPTVLGHSSLATLDVPGAAGFTLALFALWRWMQEPNPRSALLAGAAIGFAQMAKFTAFGFLLFPMVAALGFVALRKRLPVRLAAGHLAAMSVAAFVVIWASYGFETGRIHSYRHERAQGSEKELASAALLQDRYALAPSFWTGFLDMAYLQNGGRFATFMGEASSTGWRTYFPATLLFKATPAILALSAFGLFVTLQDRHRPRASLYVVLAIVGIFVVSASSRVNVGVRHLMPVFPLLSVLAGGAFAKAARYPRRTAVAGLLLSWHAGESVAAHPDYLAYFNPVIRERDYYYLSDSNLAWGQDHWRLSEWLRTHRDRDAHVVGAEGIGLLKALDWTNGPEDSQWVILDANVAALILTVHPDNALARLLKSGPRERIGRSILVFNREDVDTAD